MGVLGEYRKIAGKKKKTKKALNFSDPKARDIQVRHHAAN